MTMNDAVDAEQTEKLLAPLRHEFSVHDKNR